MKPIIPPSIASPLIVDAVHRLFDHALLAGLVTPAATCGDCGAESKTEGHHPDYAFWMQVDWLCRTCHLKRHKGCPNSSPVRSIPKPKQDFESANKDFVSIRDAAVELDRCQRTVRRWVTSGVLPSETRLDNFGRPARMIPLAALEEFGKSLPIVRRAVA